jgi:glutamate synthase (NADPH/NADH) small chain
VRDWAEVEAHLPEPELIRQAVRCMGCAVPFCFGEGCPLQNVVPEINAEVMEGRWREALSLSRLTNPFPDITGRICPALCEGACCNAKDGDAVAIRQIERELADRAWAEGWMLPRPPAPKIGRSVAVVGSGPAGLAAADALNQAGVEVTVYEAARHAGGLLRYGIPDFKLEKEVVERRIRLLEKEGIHFQCGVQIGTDISLAYLQRRHDGVLLACGVRQPRDLPVPGRDLQGIHFALDFLTRQNQVVGAELSEVGAEWSAEGRNVVVIGGGDTGSDCIGTSIRQGARRVTQIEILPQPPPVRASDNPWPQWPRILRTSSSQHEGVQRLFAIDTLAFEGDSTGRVKQLRCVEVEWLHRRPMAKAETEFTLPADLVLLAMGFTAPAPEAPRAEGQANVWEVGDMATGPSLVVRAAANGMLKAREIVAAWRNK